jgi:hypothetical protein
MAGRGEYQKQLAALVAAAKANNLKFEDILPKEVLDRFQDMAELKTAREYIKELEECEKDLRATNETLTNNLKEKQLEIGSLPADYQALEVDLQQAQRQISLYKKTSEDAQERLQRYRRQLDEIVDKQRADASAAEKVEDLQIQIENQQAVINRLMDDNRKAEAVFEQLRESDTKALERKDKQLVKKERELAEKDEMLAQLHKRVDGAKYAETASIGATSILSIDMDDEETLLDEANDDHLEVQQENIELLQQNLALSEDNNALKDQNAALNSQLYKVVEFYEMSLSHQPVPSEAPKAQLLINAVPEAKPLNRFHQIFRQVIGVFAQMFRISSQEEALPLSNLANQLDAAQNALDDYYVAKDVMRAITEEADYDDTDQIALRKELDSMAQSASESLFSLNILYTDFWGFLNQLSNDPKMLSSLNGALCDADRIHVIDLDSCD